MSTKLDEFQEVIEIPEGVNITINKHMMEFQGPLGKTFKSFRKIPVDIDVNDGKVTLKAQGKRKRDYSILHTSRSLINNICEGLTEGYTIKMKVVYAHFPITVKVQDKTILIENFQGERAPRTTRVVGNTKVIPKGEDVILTGEVLTDVTQTAANIELKTKVKNKDHRVFLDGIYIYEKKKGIEK
ncbi:MAG: 50S ribosomal protein L6 [Nitrososphaeria archaeon]|nr:50S ribosomal protein L6 [Nitrosopumilaceae archaeon]NIP09220.1 50S ribosomal protein L6 [Nitrosopumilaceae archaeon]NIP91911.1 50S ribosomal protein L6 [Nitrososphaeria archaeon]NIS96004.1 50S ribosomal protein L6 [Nitrosopumilaceae archaeon]